MSSLEINYRTNKLEKYVKITKQLCVVTEEIWQVRLRKELMKLEQ